MDKYSWGFDRTAEIWCNDTFDTIEECIDDARKVVAEEGFDSKNMPSVVYVGENEAFTLRVDPEEVLERILEDAYDFAGEVGGDWEAYKRTEKEELSELGTELTRVVGRWLERYGYIPRFYVVNNIKPYRIKAED